MTRSAVRGEVMRRSNIVAAAARSHARVAATLSPPTRLAPWRLRYGCRLEKDILGSLGRPFAPFFRVRMRA